MEGEVTDELSGRLTSFETTRVERLVNDTGNFLANDTQREVLQSVVEEAQKIMAALDKVRGNSDSVGQLLGKLGTTVLFYGFLIANALLGSVRVGVPSKLSVKYNIPQLET